METAGGISFVLGFIGMWVFSIAYFLVTMSKWPLVYDDIYHGPEWDQLTFYANLSFFAFIISCGLVVAGIVVLVTLGRE
jgi:hypothetical protein